MRWAIAILVLAGCSHEDYAGAGGQDGGGGSSGGAQAGTGGDGAGGGSAGTNAQAGTTGSGGTVAPGGAGGTQPIPPNCNIPPDTVSGVAMGTWNSTDTQDSSCRARAVTVQIINGMYYGDSGWTRVSYTTHQHDATSCDVSLSFQKTSAACMTELMTVNLTVPSI